MLDVVSASAEPKLVLAYLDPISWIAGVQLLGGGGAWLAMSWRRLFGRKSPKGGVDDTDGPLGVEAALSQLRHPSSVPRLVIVIEGARDWPFLEPIIQGLDDSAGEMEIWCLSRSTLPLDRLTRLSRKVITMAAPTPLDWKRVTAGLAHATVLTTLTDLGCAAFPKSKRDVAYVYAFHSMVSCHAAYSERAFDGYDVVLCAHERHVSELEAGEKLRGLRPKRLIAAGYPYLDTLAQNWRLQPPPSAKTVLLAPSWSSDEHFATTWACAAEAFLSAGWQVTVRPHPESLKRSTRMIERFERRFKDQPSLTFDRGAGEGEPLPNVGLLVSDWSGAAVEFAIASGRSVAFVDTPQKVRNRRWRQISATTLEGDIRVVLGPVVAPSQVSGLPTIVDHAPLCGDAPANLRFNPDNAASVAAEVVLRILRGAPP